MDMCAKNVSDRNKLAQKWTSEGRVVTPYAAEIMDVEKLRAPSYEVINSSVDVFFVFHPGGEHKVMFMLTVIKLVYGPHVHEYKSIAAESYRSVAVALGIVS
ncbi:hypothetical protein H310_14498 [Aphanomyces invadans]|uniref:Uncharacterized protein n=1 Tax=Aphanomyces invadans TaxID=157072 RepID=A0A024T9D6_9STRA|nr:hypothetical protein H310_14498 [Aphanomyces invadans]ETV90760.1 hypothetical protein H310_14498 [Aphanomyces invadans]|eukprot:XP_008880596.1 hypothetical protein H310_14498 [Aphanomyces invadans]